MKTILSCLLMAVFSLPALSQRDLPSFGKSDRSELEMTSCSFEPSANAMVLFEHTDINLIVASESSKMTIERRARIKIFNQKGFDKASISIPYFSRKKSGKIKNLKAIIYSIVDGKMVTEKLSQEDFYKLPARENLGVVKFTFPNLRPGSVIEFSYTLVLHNILQIEPWFIQRDIPVAYASTWITAPYQSSIIAYPLGTDSVTSYDEMKNQNIRRTILFKENTPSFIPEPFMSSVKDHTARVIYHLHPFGNTQVTNFTGGDPDYMWRGMMRFLKVAFEAMAKHTFKGTEAVVEKAKKIESIEERIRFIFDTTRMQLNVNTGQSFQTDDFEEIWQNREGTSAAINIILYNLLNRSGITAYPLLISTRENGHINLRYPGFGQFNGIDVIAYDSTTPYILDASSKYSKYNNPPYSILNRQALLLDKDIRWVEITDDRFLSRTDFSMLAEIGENGELKGEAVNTYYDFAKEARMDSSMIDETEDSKDKPVGLKVISYEQENFLPNDQPGREKISLVLEPQVTGDFYFYNPQSITGFKTNLFEGENRKTDVDLGSNLRFASNFRINLHSNWEIESLPKNVVIRAPDSSIVFQQIVTSDATGINYSNVLEIRRAIFQKEEYPGLREFFKLIAAKISEDVVLRRKAR